MCGEASSSVPCAHHDFWMIAPGGDAAKVLQKRDPARNFTESTFSRTISPTFG